MRIKVKNLILKESLIDEALITLGGKAYPKDNNVVIFAGGSGSGKGFIKDKLLGIEGIIFDTDELKRKYLKSLKLKTSLRDEYGLDVDNFDFKNPDDVNKLHNILNSKNIPDKLYHLVLDSVKELSNKPNIIFDVTLSTLTKFNNLSFMIREVGYNPKNIHLVWVLTEYNTALINNKQRDRVIPKIVFKDIHKGVSRTINELIQLENLSEFIDGDIWLVFNNPVSDTNLKTSNLGGSYVDKVDYVKLKSSGQSIIPYNQIEGRVIDKINSYVHHKTKWSKEDENKG